MGRRHLAILLFAFAVSVLVRLPHIGRPLSDHHEYCTALVLIFLENWRDGGFDRHKGCPTATFGNTADLNTHPASYAFAVRDGHLYYLSHAPLAYYLPHFFHSITGMRPHQSSLTWFNIFFHLITVLLLYRIMHMALPDAPLVALNSGLLYLFMPAPLWFHSNAYMADMFVQAPWALHLYLAMRVFTRQQVSTVFPIVLFCLSLFLVIFTNWLGVFAGMAGVAVAIWKSRRMKDQGWGWLAIAASFTIVLSLLLIVLIYARRLGLDDLFTYLWYRFQDRATMQFWEGGIWFHLGRLLESYRLSWGPLILFLPIATALLLLGRKRPRIGGSFRLFILLGLVPVVLDHAVLLKYAGHDFAALKAGFFLCGLAAWALHLLAQRGTRPRLLTGTVVGVLCIIGVSLYYHFNPIDDAARERYERYAQRGGQIAAEADPEGAVFALGWTPEPQDMWYARRNIVMVNDRQEAAALSRQRGIAGGVIFFMHDGILASERIDPQR